MILVTFTLLLKVTISIIDVNIKINITTWNRYQMNCHNNQNLRKNITIDWRIFRRYKSIYSKCQIIHAIRRNEHNNLKQIKNKNKPNKYLHTHVKMKVYWKETYKTNYQWTSSNSHLTMCISKNTSSSLSKKT